MRKTERVQMSVTNPQYDYYDENAHWLGAFNDGDEGQEEAENKAFSVRVSRPHDFRVFVKMEKNVGFWKWKKKITYWKHQFSVRIWWCDSMPKKSGFIDNAGRKVHGR